MNSELNLEQSEYSSVTELPRGSYEDAHSWSVEEPLHDLSKNCEVLVIGCQPESISAPDVELGLTNCVEEAIPKAIENHFKRNRGLAHVSPNKRIFRNGSKTSRCGQVASEEEVEKVAEEKPKPRIGYVHLTDVPETLCR